MADSFKEPQGTAAVVTDVPKFSIPVDSEYKSKVLRIWSWQRPHHLSFQLNWISFFMSFVVTFAASSLSPVIRNDLDLTKPELANAGIAAVTGVICMRIAMGSICDAFGPRFGHAFLMLFTASATYGMALVSSYGGYVACRLFIGLSLAAFVCCQYWCSIMFSPNIVGTANAVAGGWGNMGGGVTMLLTPFLYKGFQQIHPDFIAWRVVYYVLASLQILIAIAILLFAQDMPLGNYSALKKKGEMNKPKWTRELWAAVSNYRMWILLVGYGFCFGVELTVENVIAEYFHDQFKLSVTTAGVYASLFGLQNLYARALGGILSDVAAKRFGMRGRIWSLWAVQTAGGVFCIILGLVQNSLAATIVVLVLFSTCCFAACGATYGIVPFVSRRALGLVCGFVGAGGNAGSAITQAAFFVNAGWTTYAGFFWMGIITVVVSQILLLIYFPMWGGAFCKAKEGWTEEEYYSRDFSAAERDAGLHVAILRFANESRSQRGFKEMTKFAASSKTDAPAPHVVTETKV